MQILTSRLLIRPLVTADYPAIRDSHLRRLRNQSRFDVPIGFGEFARRDDFRNWVAVARKKKRRNEIHVLGIFLRSTGDFIGNSNLFTINWANRWANLGYHIQNQHFGNGYALEAAIAVAQYGFEKIGYHRIELGCDIRNVASIRLANKLVKQCGFEQEGIRRDFFSGAKKENLLFFGCSRRRFRKPNVG
jgi:RimJ/RimL family protein N-acetyltransferase